MDNPNSDKADSNEERLLLETKISLVLSKLSLLKPDEPNYTSLDQEYRNLLQRRKGL
jgi:macrolide transport system ATP-binding/permease protein